MPLPEYHKAKKLYLPAGVVAQGQCTIPFRDGDRAVMNTSPGATFGAEAHRPVAGPLREVYDIVR